MMWLRSRAETTRRNCLPHVVWFGLIDLKTVRECSQNELSAVRQPDVRDLFDGVIGIADLRANDRSRRKTEAEGSIARIAFMAKQLAEVVKCLRTQRTCSSEPVGKRKLHMTST